MRTRHPAIIGFALAAFVALVGLVAAGCGGSDSSSDTAAASPTTTATTGGSASGGGVATIDVADNPDLGQILTDGSGNTVYLFENDENGMSSCSGECATAWPPVTTSGGPKAGNGADQALLGTVKRDDGAEQVTYAGHPLYLYAGDTQPGDANGNELDQFGAEWYALTPDGSNAEGGASDESGSTEGSTSTSDSSSNSGYGY